MIVFRAAPAAAIQFDAAVPMRFATASALDNYLPTQNCDPSLCSQITSSSPDVYTSDFQAAYWWQVMNAAVGETIAVNAADPNGKLHTYLQLTYSNSISACYQGTGWTDNFGQTFCDPDGSGDFVTGINVTCGPVGAWTLGLYDNGNLYSQTPFSLVHNPLGPLGITSPTDDEIFDLDQQNYTSTDSVPFSAGTVTGNPINWAVTVSYATSGGYGSFSNTLPSFQTAGAATQNQTFQSEGGQVHVTASTTASDGSTVQDCVTFYIDGVQAGIPNASITSQLNALYQSSSSYPTDPTEQYPPTPNLMTGVANVESSYEQFRYPSTGSQPEPDLYPAVYAVWPTENSAKGSNIGLMQVETDSNQNSDPNAWNWLTNTVDGVGLFSGTPPAEYGTQVRNKLYNPNKIQTAETYESEIMSNYPAGALPPLVGWKLENMALLLYGPGASSNFSKQYYEPTCSGTIDKKNDCSTGWQWSENTGNPEGTAYVDLVRTKLFN